MKAEIITIGDELLIGQTIDTNSAWIAHKLNLIGVDIIKIVSISDKKDEITKALDNAKQNAELVLITGGLGPTNDDITKKTLANYYGVKLVQNKEVLKHVEGFAIKRKLNMNERNVRQAEVPENCTILHNEIGTAPGMLFNDNNKIIISMPGVPFEMKELMNNNVIPLLKEKKNNLSIIHKIVLTQGISESKLAEVLEGWESKLPDELSLAYLPSPGIIKLRLTAKGNNKQKLEKILQDQISKLEKIIPKLICGYDLEKLEELVGKLLIDKGKTLSTAESCTGGNIAHLITSIPGSSDYFKGSVVAYSNEIKQNILSVSSSNLNNYGAVSKQVVEEMVLSIKKLFNTDFAIAISGIAGPSGGTVDKPVGTTWIAVADNDKVITKKYIFGDHRERNIKRASLTALNLLQKLILRKEM